MTFRDIPPAVQEQLQKLQDLQNQVQTLRIQLDANQREFSEIKGTLKEIEGLNDDDELYKTVGPIFFKNSVKKVRFELNERIEFIELKINSLKKQEERSKKHLDELNKTISLQFGKTSK
ncbi:MAG: prefoldin subunit beta [Candidatus Hodarchaeales archaeon]|jgi:prefoldin beta subunit